MPFYKGGRPSQKISQCKSDNKGEKKTEKNGKALTNNINMHKEKANQKTHKKRDDNINRNRLVFFVPFDFHAIALQFLSIIYFAQLLKQYFIRSCTWGKPVPQGTKGTSGADIWLQSFIYALYLLNWFWYNARRR
jgi:hypothetical protein